MIIEWIKVGEWIYEKCGEENWHTAECSYDDKEEAIEAGRQHMKDLIQDEEYDGEQFEIAQVVDFNFKVDTSQVIEQVVDQAYDQVGDLADRWLDHVYNEYELQEMLTNAFKEWLNKYPVNKPKFWCVENRETVSIEEDFKDLPRWGDYSE